LYIYKKPPSSRGLYGDTAAGALAASEIIKQQFSQEFPLPKEFS
jgi:hypothetical protein